RTCRLPSVLCNLPSHNNQPVPAAVDAVLPGRRAFTADHDALVLALALAVIAHPGHLFPRGCRRADGWGGASGRKSTQSYCKHPARLGAANHPRNERTLEEFPPPESPLPPAARLAWLLRMGFFDNVPRF